MSWDQSRFDNLLDDYVRISMRTVGQTLNTKLYYIARGAARLTYKTPREKIERSLGRYVTVEKQTKKGGIRRSRRIELVDSTQHDAPLAALIANKLQGRKHEAGLYGRKMAKRIKELLGSRFRSIAFIKSGWIPAIKILAANGATTGAAPPTDTEMRQYGRPKGDAVPALLNAERPGAMIRNSAYGSTPGGDRALQRVGAAGLQMAFDEEAASMESYMLDKLNEDALRAGRELV